MITVRNTFGSISDLKKEPDTVNNDTVSRNSTVRNREKRNRNKKKHKQNYTRNT